MQLKLDVKTLLIGILLGAALIATIGAGVGSADATRFGIAVGSGGSAIIATQDGTLYVVNADTAMATPILQARSLNTNPGAVRDYKGRIFNLTTVTIPPNR
ncbi:MAG: hypothetical protein KAS75_08780 [Planctomycetes bacterium]|nr:hypothetical protein [Planctomycetota bacterium]